MLTASAARAGFSGQIRAAAVKANEHVPTANSRLLLAAP